jgi:WD40 repeat protein
VIHLAYHKLALRILFCGLLLIPVPAAENRPIPVADSARTSRVSFHREVLPVLQANCLPCHNQTSAKGGLNLETPDAMLKGGDSGPALVPAKPADSRLLQAAAHQLEDLIMPPAGNKVRARDLNPQELGLLSLWIKQGAEAEPAEIARVSWQTFPTNVVSSLAVALTGDGDLVAAARANRVFVYHAKTGRLAGQLSDPAVDGAAQRDWVNALAFSPDGEWLAAAGYREVRLWQQRPVTIQPAWSDIQNAHFQAAAFSDDRSQVACVTSSGELEIRRAVDGSLLRSWSFDLATPVRIAWSGTGKFLALAEANLLRVISPAVETEAVVQPLAGDVTALAWFDHDHQLAVALSETNTIQIWRAPEPLKAGGTATNLVAAGERTGYSAHVTALASERGGKNSFVSAHADGTLRRWFPESATAPQEIQLKGSIIGVDFAGPGVKVVARLAEGGSALVSFEKTPRVAGTFGGDPRLSKTIAELEDALALSQAELARATKLIAEAEAAAKSGDETLKKAREKREAQTKTLAEKEKALKEQRDAEGAAVRERDQLDADLQRILAAAQAAEKALEEIRAIAQTSADQDAAAQVAASAAERLQTELERLVASLPESDKSEAAVKTREAKSIAAREAASRSAERAEKRARAVQSREELASRAFAAGEKSAEKKRAESELPPRKKQAEERLATAQKAIKDLQPQVDKARITLEGGTQDVALAEKSVAAASESLTQARDACEAARRQIAIIETQIAGTRAAQDRATSSPLAGCAASLDGKTLLTLAADGVATQWDIATSNALVTFKLPAPLALASVAEDEWIAVFSNSVTRVNTARPWTLHRTIGGADSSPEPFADRVNALAFSPDGRLLATGGGEPSRAGELKLWRVSDGALERDLGGIHSDAVMAVAFSPRGDWLASGGADRFARLTPVSGDAPRLNLEGHTQHVLDVAWLADGSTLATAGADGVVKLWNPKTGERRKNVEGFGKEVTGLEPIGATNQFAAVSGSGQSRIFRSDGEKVRDFPAVPAFLLALAVTRNGRLAAAAADDGTIRLWDTQTGKEILQLPPQ